MSSGPTAREIADLTARLHRLSTPGRHVDPYERAAFLTDKNALLDRIAAAEGAPAHGPADEVVSYREAADRLTAMGNDQARAEAMIADYLDETSREVGVSVRQWGLDQHDIDAIASRNPPGCFREYEPGSDRREQLARWHADDHATAGSTDAQEGRTDVDGR
jgi:hypothetical protein